MKRAGLILYGLAFAAFMLFWIVAIVWLTAP